MADDKPERMFNHAARQAQVAQDVEVIWDPDRPRNDKLNAAERIVHAAQTQALPAPNAAHAVAQVWRLLELPHARALAQKIPVNTVKRYPDYVMP